LLKGIGVCSLSKLAENLHSLLRAHHGTGESVGFVGFFEAVEDLHCFLHLFSILRPNAQSVFLCMVDPRYRKGV
jgi:hypothetical protein